MSESETLVTVGRPLMPDPVRIGSLMAEAVATGWLTHGGLLHGRLEAALAPLFGGGALRLTPSGTMALMMALRLGGLPEGAEVITTPISFPASVQAIRWCGFRPIFADVEADTLTLCPRAVRAAVTARTAAILPVHMLGVPCDVEGLAEVATDHGLWLAYDAAHAFGLTLHGRPIAAWGNVSAFSLNATKLMHTGEGGALVLPSGGDATQIAVMRHCGIANGRMVDHGTNANLSEAQAAVGLAILPLLEAEIAARQALRARYNVALASVRGIRPQPGRAGASDSLLYYAVRMRPLLRARLQQALAKARIFGRDFPLLCGPDTCLPRFPIVTAAPEPIAPMVASELLCLPFHGKVGDRDVECIARIAQSCADEETSES